MLHWHPTTEHLTVLDNPADDPRTAAPVTN